MRTTAEQWEALRRWLWSSEALGVSVDVSRMGIDDQHVEGLSGRFANAFSEMDALEKGAIANPDEQRMVGHYWLRAPELAPSPQIAAAIRETVDRACAFAKRVHDGEVAPERGGRFTHLVAIGIGGSALGPELAASALGTPRDPVRPHFIDNTDPDGIDRVLGEIGPDLARTLTIVVSKSGGTAETRNGMLEAAEAYRRAGLRFERHAVAVTGEGSQLDRAATEGGWIERFPMWDWVGGRTSELSAVGLLPAALQGIDVLAMIAGARAMDVATRSRSVRENPAALLALAWHVAGDGRGRRDMVVLPYKDRLELFSRYLQQLVMESLGKELDRQGNVVHQGLAVYGNKGSTDQHAFVQQLRDGLDNFFVTFVEVLEDRAGPSLAVEPGVTAGDYLSGFLQGTRTALTQRGRPSLTITIDRVDAASMGKLIALFERAVGLYASLVGLNAYHQPGVEAGKKAAAEVISAQARIVAALRGRAGLRLDEIAQAARIDDLDMVFTVLRHLAANPDSGIRRTPGASPFDGTYSG
ncbi:MAG: glucose-6-phosphate isomerase [Deltaproteobacteria bacterium]|nr:glucose-6-phosphate isomerase [Deltaproteobacteria bacterium]